VTARRHGPFTAFALAALAALSCRPDFGERPSLVVRTEVLAVRGEPPEVAPGAGAVYSLLVASPDGPVAAPPASWAYCATPKLLSENGVASQDCLRDDAVRPVGAGTSSVTAAVPADACSLFGPDVSSADLRPRDPDVTGGFFQPLRVTLPDGSVAYGLERLGCKLANAPADVAADFGKRYVPNKNPTLAPLVVTDRTGAAVPVDGVPAGATVMLRASWPPEAVERYVVYDPTTASLVDHRESMRVSWFVTKGSLESDRTGRDEGETETFTDDAWTAPGEAATTHLFWVLRDSRGGVAFATAVLVTR
jgi:hypothetical protein